MKKYKQLNDQLRDYYHDQLRSKLSHDLSFELWAKFANYFWEQSGSHLFDEINTKRYQDEH